MKRIFVFLSIFVFINPTFAYDAQNPQEEVMLSRGYVDDLTWTLNTTCELQSVLNAKQFRKAMFGRKGNEPELISALKILCPHVSELSKEQFVKVGFPIFDKYVSSKYAQDIVQYYQSPLGDSVDKKIRRATEMRVDVQLSADESRLRSMFHNSPAGIALRGYEVDKLKMIQSVVALSKLIKP